MSPTKSSRGDHKQIDKNALLVAQEITFAQILSGNDPKTRERGIKRLQKWLTARSSSSCQFKENDLKRIWKGLFYCMWMSDKPLIQEEVAENISNLVHCFKNTKAYIFFVKCFFLTMAAEWRGLDQWRTDKFLMFVRRFLRQVFVYCNQRSWPLKLVKELGSVFNATILPDHKALSEIVHPPIGFSFHFVDIYMDELTKVSKGHLQNDELLVALLRPFAVYLCEAPEQAIAKQIVSQIFDRLIEQSEEGHKFREKFEAWKQLGFPHGNIDAVERVHRGDSDEEMDEDEADDDEKGALDPRAGGVNVDLPVANYNPETVSNLLREYRHSKTSNSWSRKVVKRVMDRFNAMAKGKYPLGFKKVDKVPKINLKKMAEESAEELVDFRDRIMYEDDDEWMERIQREKKSKKSAEDEDDDNEELDDDEDSDEEGDDDEEVDDDVDEDDDDIDNGEVDDSDGEDDAEVNDSDGEDDAEVNDSDGEDDAEVDDSDGEDDAEVNNDEAGDVADCGIDISTDEEDEDLETGVDSEELETGVHSEELETGVDSEELETGVDSEELETGVHSVEDEPVKVKSGKKNKKKKNTFIVQEETPQKKTPKNLPKVIPFGSNSKKQKNSQSVEEETPQKKSPKNSPQVITNGISKKQKNQLEKPKKEETVIIVGRKRKLAEALATPIIHRGKQFRNSQNSPRTPQTPGSAKRVQFILQRNTAQATSEYDRILRENPDNPYDSAKKPRFSVLKSTPLASPVNPFYKQ